MRALLDAGASVNAKDADGQMPLIKAVARGHRWLVITLGHSRSGPHRTIQHGLTALMIAAERRDRAFRSKLNELSPNIAPDRRWLARRA